MCKQFFCAISFLIFSTALFCQNENTDSTKIRSFADKIILKANIETRNTDYSVKSANENFQLSTNNEYRLFVSFDYQFIGFTIGYSPKFLPDNNDNNLQGKSTFNDFQFRFFLGNWVQRLQYSKTKGFYVQNTGDFLNNWTQGVDPFIQLPDFTTYFWGGSTSYILNPNFSFRNIVYNTEWQLKSAGSFVPSLKYGFTKITSPISTSEVSEQDLDLRFSPEYYQAWVLHKNWFVAPYFAPSLGIRFSTDKENDTITDRNTYFTVGLGGGLQLGYSSERMIFGIAMEFDSTFYNEANKTNVVNDQFYGKAYLGFRLEAPKFVQKLF